MGEFFRGWRRKIGVLTLIVACLFMGIWIKGLRTRSEFTFGFDDKKIKTTKVFAFNHSNQGRFLGRGNNKSFYQLVSADGITLRKYTATNPEMHIGYHAGWRDFPVAQNDYLLAVMMLNRTVWRWHAFGFDLGETEDEGGTENIWAPRIRLTFWTIPYWSIVVPLTLLSAYLLLSKPRKSTPKKSPEPISAEGT